MANQSSERSVLGAAAALWLAAAPAALAADCQLDGAQAPDQTVQVEATVKGMVSTAVARNRTRIAEDEVHAKVSPKYRNLPRVDVTYQQNGASLETMAALVAGAPPKTGDTVMIASRHRDPDRACNFIPWTVVPR